MSPASSCFSLTTSAVTWPLRSVALAHFGSSRVEDTTYLGMPLSRSAHSPLRPAHRAANHSSLRRPSSRASVPSASPSEILAHSSRSWPPNSPNQPPSLKPSLPSGSWTTPSSEAFVLMTIFPMSGSPLLPMLASADAEPSTRGNWAAAGQPVRVGVAAAPGDRITHVQADRQQRLLPGHAGQDRPAQH